MWGAISFSFFGTKTRKQIHLVIVNQPYWPGSEEDADACPEAPSVS